MSGVDDPGGFAEYVTTGASETICCRIELELQSAALVEPLAVGIHAVRMADVKAGSRVMVIGAGPHRPDRGAVVPLFRRARGRGQ